MYISLSVHLSHRFSRVKLFGRAVLDNAASSNTGVQASARSQSAHFDLVLPRGVTVHTSHGSVRS